MTRSMTSFLSIFFVIMSLLVTKMDARAEVTGGLTAHYPFDGNANDESGLGNPSGIVYGATLTADRFGNPNSAYYFNGAGDYIRIPYNANFDLNPAGFTVAVWVKGETSQSSIYDILDKSHYGSGGWSGSGWCLEGIPSLYMMDPSMCPSGHCDSFHVFSFNTDIVIPTANMIDNTWHHFTGSYDGSNMRVYLDGVLVDQKPVTSPVFSPNSGDMFVGTWGGWSRFFHGALDDFRIYDRQLTDQEIRRLGGAACAPPANGLVSWWRGEDSASDSAGVNNGTLFGEMGFAEGKIGRSFLFDGQNDYIRVENNTSLHLGSEHSIAFWFKPRNYPQAGLGSVLVSKRAYALEHTEVGIVSDGRIYYYLYHPFSPDTPLLSSSSLDKETWYFVVATYDGSKAQIFINGMLDSSVPAFGTVNNSSAALYFGYNPYQDWFYRADYLDGQMDEMTWYNRGLTAVEIQGMYEAGISGVCSAPDSTPPVITPQITGTLGSNEWFRSDVRVDWSVTDGESAITSTAGCDQTTITSDTTGTTLTCTATSAGGTSTRSVTIKRDTTAPTVVCGFADGLWHSDNVAIACSADDAVSGLADSGDAGFALTTSVAAGSETADANTDSRPVADLAGNSTTAGPIGGNRIDRKAPDIIITLPAGPEYILNQPVSSSYSCTDGGSGVAACAGPVPAGSNIDTASVGVKTFTVNAKDNAGNSAAADTTYRVSYRFSGFFPPIGSPPTVNTGKSGRTYSVKWQLSDYYNALVPALDAVESISYTPTSCGMFVAASTNEVEAYFLGATSLKYDAEANQYVYKWHAPGPGCYTLRLMLRDKQMLPAFFELR